VKGARLNPFWRQLPVYSPVTFGSLWAGLAGALGRGDPLGRLRTLLLDEYDSADVLLVDSGTSALRLAIEGSIAETGSEIVALPAYCCFDVATAAVGADARIAIYDVLPETLGPDFDSLRAALEAGARTIAVVHLYGIPVDLDRSRELAAEFSAVLIEDAAQGAGGSWCGRQLGAWGDLGILSFGRGKGRTGGGGGALLANSERGLMVLSKLNGTSAAASRGTLNIAKLAAQWAFGRPTLYGLPASLPFLGLGETKYKAPWPPAGMAPGPAAATLSNWEPSKEEESVRRCCVVNSALASVGRAVETISFQCDQRGVAGYLRFPVLVTDRSNDETGRLPLTPSYPLLISELPCVSRRMVGKAHGWRAAELCEKLFTFPSHSLSVRGSASHE